MAILKAINVKGAGRKKFLETLEYVSNPKKIRTCKRERKNIFQKQTWMNRCLGNKDNSKRQFKQFVVSLEKKWSSKTSAERVAHEELLHKVATKCEVYFAEKGFLSQAYIHSNTEHSHIHLLVETLSVKTWKQYSQSKEDLKLFKLLVSDLLIEAGLGETILMEVQELTEEEFYIEEENVFMEDGYEEDYEESKINEWNNGTLEQGEEMYIEQYPLRIMVNCIDNSKGREMCHIVQKEQNQGREMSCIIPEEKKKGREMCIIVKKRN